MIHPTRALGLGLLVAGGLAARAATQADAPPVELGLVQWERNFEAAKTAAKEANKPILLLFQEVPG
jgi:hypothetical protein